MNHSGRNVEKHHLDDTNKEKLILEVKKHPPLWNRHLREHRDRLVFDAAWEEVAYELRDVFESKRLLESLGKIYTITFEKHTALLPQKRAAVD